MLGPNRTNGNPITLLLPTTSTVKFSVTMRLLEHNIKSEWRLKRRDPKIENVLDELKKWDLAFAYFGSITIPSEVHVELLKAKLIPDLPPLPIKN